MTEHILETPRLRLRPVELSDAPAIFAWVSDYEVAKNLARVPHPYGEDDAIGFLQRQLALRDAGTDFAFAITDKDGGTFYGCCGIHLGSDGLFELGYWLGQPYWGRGYATEAARAVAGFAFAELKAERITAGWFEGNPASGHVLAKIGFVPAGMAPRHCLARGHAVDCHLVLLERDGLRAVG